MDYILLIVGFILLVKCADIFVDGSSNLAKALKIPTLIINARDDSFLGRDCYPIEEAKNNPLLFLDMPKHGGHVGFFGPRNISYSEKIGLKFINEFFAITSSCGYMKSLLRGISPKSLLTSVILSST